MSKRYNRVFYPAEGALLDLQSLDALAFGPSQLLGAWMDVSLGQYSGGVVLRGLEIVGTPEDLFKPGDGAGAAPCPGVIKADLKEDRILTVSPGVALVRRPKGRHHLVWVTESMTLEWRPEHRTQQSWLCLWSELPRGESAPMMAEGLSAYRVPKVNLEFINRSSIDDRDVPIAMPLGDSGRFAQDIRRIWAPGHPDLEALLRRLKSSQQRVWEVKPRASQWDTHHYSENWVQYQTVATAALQAAIQRLGTGPTHTQERVRALELLVRALRSSVAQVGQELEQALFGAELEKVTLGAKAADPYAELRELIKPEGQ